MAVRKRRPTKVKRKRRPGTVRPISKTSPKGKIALLMLEGSHTYAGMAKKRARRSTTFTSMQPS